MYPIEQLCCQDPDCPDAVVQRHGVQGAEGGARGGGGAKLVFGAMLLLGAYLERSPVRAAINTAFVERNNGTDRHQDARKRRKTCGSSMDIEAHHAASYLIG